MKRVAKIVWVIAAILEGCAVILTIFGRYLELPSEINMLLEKQISIPVVWIIAFLFLVVLVINKMLDNSKLLNIGGNNRTYNTSCKDEESRLPLINITINKNYGEQYNNYACALMQRNIGDMENMKDEAENVDAHIGEMNEVRDVGTTIMENQPKVKKVGVDNSEDVVDKKLYTRENLSDRKGDISRTRKKHDCHKRNILKIFGKKRVRGSIRTRTVSK